jgi:hypothetical protein
MIVINERFDDELCGPCLKTITLYRVSNGNKINEILVDSENNKITFYMDKKGHKNDNRLKNIKIIDPLLPNGKIELNDKGEYFWKADEWKMIKNFIKFYNIFN